jgi:hypothetical protein
MDLLTEFAPLTLAVALYAWWCWRGLHNTHEEDR